MEVTRGLSEHHDMEIERLGSDRDQNHQLCPAHPKIAARQIVQVYKRITGRELLWRKPVLKKKLWRGMAGYRTVCASGRPREELRQLTLF